MVDRLSHTPLRLTDHSLLLTLSGEYLSTLITLGTHLLFHRITYVSGRVDVL